MFFGISSDWILSYLKSSEPRVCFPLECPLYTKNLENDICRKCEDNCEYCSGQKKLIFLLF